MDTLSLTASIIAVLQLSFDVVKYISSAKGATKERRRLRDEIRACQAVLLQLQDYSDDEEEREERDKGMEWRDKIKALGGPLHQLEMILKTLESKLQPKRGLHEKISGLKWPFKEAKIADLIYALERHKSLLQLAVTEDCKALVRNVKQHAALNGQLLETVLRTLQDSAIDSDTRLSRLTSVVLDIRDSQGELQNLTEKLCDHNDISDRQETLNWVTKVDFSLQHSEFIRQRHPGSCRWFLDSPQLRQWLKKKGDTLFCPGIPGAGKSILTAILVEELEERYEDADVGIAYIYCDFRKQNEWRAEDLLQSLLKQLAHGRAALPETLGLLKEKHTKKQTRPSLNEISTALQSVAAMYSRVFILIDAIDECQVFDGCRTKLLTEIFSLRDESGVNIMATARNIPEIAEKFAGNTVLEVYADDVDIRSYIDNRMPLLQLPYDVRQSAEKQEKIKACVIQSAQRMFLLAKLHLDSLEGTICVRQVLDMLEKLPTGSNAYDCAYQKTMERIEAQSVARQDLAKKVLSWITCAKRRLTASELREAIATEVGKSVLDKDNLSDIQDIMSVCAGLVVMDGGSGIVRLIHYTTQEYFERTREHWFPNVETEIAETCTTYLSFATFEDEFHHPGIWPSQQLLPHPLYDYAARYWAAHAYLASSNSKHISRFLSSQAEICSGFLLWAAMEGEEDSVRWLVERGFEVNGHDENWRTPLHYASLHQRTGCVQLLLEHGANLTTDIDNMTPFHYSVLRSNEKLAQAFLNAGISVDISVTRKVWLPSRSSNHQGRVSYEQAGGVSPQFETKALHQQGLTALHFAALVGDKEMTEFLLNQEANPNAISEHGETPLHLALKRNLHATKSPGYIDCWNDPSCRIEESIDMIGYGPGSDDEYSWTCSQVEEHRCAVVGLLLDHRSTNANARDIFDTQPLHCVIYGKPTTADVVNQLIGKGANVSARDRHGKTPLHLACSKGDIDSAKKLMEHGSDAADGDVRGRNALHYAAGSRNQELMCCLIGSVPSSDSVAFVRTKDKHGRNVLHHLLNCGGGIISTLVEYLLKYEVGVNDLDDDGLSPLAAYLGNTLFAHDVELEVVRLLFRGGADPSFKTTKGLGLAHLYAKTLQLRVDLLKLLAHSGVDLRKRDDEGRTPLHYTGISGNLTADALYYLCTDMGLSRDSCDAYGKTASCYAAENRKNHPHCFDAGGWSRTETLLGHPSGIKNELPELL